MQLIINNKKYPLRFDMLCFRKVKTKTGLDLIKGAGAFGSEELVVLAHAAIESGCKFEGIDCGSLTEDDIANNIKAEEIKKIIEALTVDLGINPTEKKEPSEGGDSAGE